MKLLLRLSALPAFLVIYYLLVAYGAATSYLFNDKKLAKYYMENKGNAQKSISTGVVSNGTLMNGKLIPFSGKNYSYFSKWSYLQGRGYLNGSVLDGVLDSYKALETECKDRQFKIMECSHKKGGKLWPHRTHQNGLSVDFMMPLKKEGKPCYDYDDKGIQHYAMDFDNTGRYTEDSIVSIDFNTAAQHILSVDQHARKYGYRIKKVIIKIALKDELYASYFGKKLKEKGIYVVKYLRPKIDNLHDDHYHLDFEKVPIVQKK